MTRVRQRGAGRGARAQQEWASAVPSAKTVEAVGAEWPATVDKDEDEEKEVHEEVMADEVD